MSIQRKIQLFSAALMLVAFTACTGSKKGGKGCDCPGFGQKEAPLNLSEGETSS